MNFFVRSKAAIICAGSMLLIGMWLFWSTWSAGKIFTECHKLQQYTPETDAAYMNCMEENGLDSEDWE